MADMFYPRQTDYIDKLNELYEAFTNTSAGGISKDIYESPDATQTQGHALNGVGVLKAYDAIQKATHGNLTVAAMPRLFKKLRDYNSATKPILRVCGFGSSVGVGATLPSANDAPVAVFTTKLKAVLDPAGMYDIRFTNYSVNGSTVSEFPTAWATMLAAGQTCDVALFCYGMNDGAVSQFNGGETYGGGPNDGFKGALARAIYTVQKAGGDVVVATTPHASVVTYQSSLYTMPSGVPQQYPVFVAAPVAPESLVPKASESNITGDFLQNGLSITVGHRYKRINEAMRSIALSLGCAVMDAERYWFEELQLGLILTGTMQGAEARLFNSGEFVHPNEIGHKASYGRATDDFMASIASCGIQNGVDKNIFGLLSVNAQSQVNAVLDLSGVYADLTTKLLSVKAQIGTPDANTIPAQVEVLTIDPANGRLTTPAITLGAKSTDKKFVMKNALEEMGYIDEYALYNLSASVAVAHVLEDNKGTRITIRAIQNGVATSQIYDNILSTHNGVTTLGTGSALREIAAGVEFTVSVSGLSLQITPVYPGTALYIRTETF